MRWSGRNGEWLKKRSDHWRCEEKARELQTRSDRESERGNGMGGAAFEFFFHARLDCACTLPRQARCM